MESTTTDPPQNERQPATGRLLITGANGYIGRRLVAAASERGFEIVAAVRDPDRFRTRAGTAVRRFDLKRPVAAEELTAGVDAVIHLAAILAENSRPAGAEEDQNVSGTRRLLEAARVQRVRRFVFLSSRSAAPDSPTRYGRSKWRIEQMLTLPGECAVRTGLVAGGPPRGVYGALFRMARRFPLLPMIRPRAPVYPVHVDDLCAGLLSLVQHGPTPPGLMRLASARSVPFGDFLRALALQRLGRRLRLLPIPPRLVLALCRLSEVVPGLPTIPRERVLGLIALRPMDAGSLPGPPAAPPLRDAIRALAAEGRSRRLLGEARTLLSYVLGCRAGSAVSRRYVRAVLAEDDREPIDFGCILRAWPRLLRAIEPLSADDSRFRSRLTIATRIAEMTVEAAPRFHNYRGRRWIAWPALVWLLATEALLLPLRWLAGRFGERK